MGHAVIELPVVAPPAAWSFLFPDCVLGVVSRPADSRAARLAAKSTLTSLLISHFHTTNPSSAAPAAFSYSHVPGLTWGATTLSRRIGIDAACDEEFDPTYPLHRAFHPSELSLATPACLWAVKEAVVKALGSGWNEKKPLDLCIYAEMHVSGFEVQVFRYGKFWVSVAI